MDHLQWYDYLRLAGSVVAVTAMYFLGSSFLRRRQDYSRRLVDFWWAMNVAMFTIFTGSIEQVIRDRDATWTLPLSFCTAVVCLKAALNKDRTLLKSDSES